MDEIKVKVLLDSWLYDKKYITVKLSTESIKDIIKLFNSRTFGPTVDDLYRIIYWELKEQGYDLDNYHIRDVEVVEE